MVVCATTASYVTLVYEYARIKVMTITCMQKNGGENLLSPQKIGLTKSFSIELKKYAVFIAIAKFTRYFLDFN